MNSYKIGINDKPKKSLFQLFHQQQGKKQTGDYSTTDEREIILSVPNERLFSPPVPSRLTRDYSLCRRTKGTRYQTNERLFSLYRTREYSLHRCCHNRLTNERLFSPYRRRDNFSTGVVERREIILSLPNERIFSPPVS